MRTRIYVSASGPKAAIVALGEHAGDPAGARKLLHAEDWRWSLPAKEFGDPPFPDEVERYFAEHSACLARLASFPKDAVEVFVQIVAERGDGERRDGYYLSRSAIMMIGLLGASLDIDVIERQ